MQVQFDTKIPKLKIKYTQKKSLFWVLDLIQQNLSKQNIFLGRISEFSVGSRLGAEMSRTGILFNPTLQTHPCNENKVFPVNFFSQGKPVFSTGIPALRTGSKLLLWMKSNNSLNYKLCNQKKVNQLNKKKNINTVQHIRKICVHT